MQGLPLEALECGNQFGTCALGQSGPPAIDGITDQRVADVRHVDPDLMRTAGLELDFDQGVGRKSFMNPIVGDGGFSIRSNGKALAVAAVTTDREVDGASPGQGSLHQGKVLAMHGVRLELFDQQFVGFNSPRHHQKPAGVLVDPVHNARSRDLVERRGVVQ